jgi:hypothetical protein
MNLGDGCSKANAHRIDLALTAGNWDRRKQPCCLTPCMASKYGAIDSAKTVLLNCSADTFLGLLDNP